MQPDCNRRPSFPRRALVPVLLAVAILAGQVGASLHALGHALERLGAAPTLAVPAPASAMADGKDHGDKAACPLHALFAELGSAATGRSATLPASASPAGTATCAEASPRAAPRVVYRSRAPPVLPA